MSFQGSISDIPSFFSADVPSQTIIPGAVPGAVPSTPERRPTLPVQNAPARPIQIESVDIDPINNRLIFDDALVPIEHPLTNDNLENDLDYFDDHDDYSDERDDYDDCDDHDDDDHDYTHYCGSHTCSGDCGVLSCGCIDTCRRHCVDDGDYDDYDDY